ncbi:MAG: nicotinamide mononucleotide transporter [Bacteroidales bacterium]|nr:nicotinamide mononucleotide transporter [Bacteroidales bacterium]
MDLLIEWARANYIELISIIFSVSGVILATKQIIWNWPLALIGVIAASVVFYDTKLYLATLLQVFYFFFTLYGWYNWQYGGSQVNAQGEKKVLKVTDITKKQSLIFFISGCFAAIILGYIFNKWTDATFPFIDSVTTTCGIIGTYFMAKKIIQHWFIWLFNDSICVVLYFYKGLYGFTILYFLYLLLATYGYFEWKKDLVKTD